MMRWLAGLLVLALLLAGPAPGTSGDSRAAGSTPLVLGLGGEVTSLDPHYHNYTPNKVVWRHVFDSLTLPERDLTVRPGLAASWRRLDETTWEFALRPGVHFHDGTPFTAADAAASLTRAGLVENAPQPVLVPALLTVEATGPLSLRITTISANAQLPHQLSAVAIMPVAENRRSRADFDRNGRLIGTGPYRFVSWQPGQRVELRANPDYWGPVPRWSPVSLRLLPDDGARIAALIAGEVQVIDHVVPNDLARLSSNPAFTVTSTGSRRLIYLSLDCERLVSPFVRAADGSGPLSPNPLRDPRVRRALSKAINRDDLTRNVLHGLGEPAGQVAPDGFDGVSPRLRPEPFDPAGAHQLLAQAGYPDGFALTLHGPARRYPGDVAVLSAIAAMLTRAGVATEALALPNAEFFPRASQREFSLLMAGFASPSRETLDLLLALVATYDPLRGLGSLNRGRYHNARLDALLIEARASVDPPARHALLVQAAELAEAETAIIPLYHERAAWAARDGLVYQARSDELTLAPNVTTSGRLSTDNGTRDGAPRR